MHFLLIANRCNQIGINASSFGVRVLIITNIVAILIITDIAAILTVVSITSNVGFLIVAEVTFDRTGNA